MGKVTPLPVQELEVVATDGHGWNVLSLVPANPRVCVLWLPALGVAARHYLPLARALAASGAAVFLHEWRGHGSSTLRAGRDCDWGYRELLELDLPASEAALAAAVPANLPRVLGGHSLGGQLASCRVALNPDSAGEVWLVASGAPWWREFPFPANWGVLGARRILPWLAKVNGSLPGRQIRFGGRESRGVITDWALSAKTDRYAARGLDVDLEHALSNACPAVRAVILADDWYAPLGSLQWLLDKMPQTEVSLTTLDEDALGIDADHFKWMQRPEAVAAALMDSHRAQEPAPTSTG